MPAPELSTELNKLNVQYMLMSLHRKYKFEINSIWTFTMFFINLGITPGTLCVNQNVCFFLGGETTSWQVFYTVECVKSDPSWIQWDTNVLFFRLLCYILDKKRLAKIALQISPCHVKMRAVLKYYILRYFCFKFLILREIPLHLSDCF